MSILFPFFIVLLLLVFCLGVAAVATGFRHHQDAVAAANELKATVGVVDHGLFIGMTTAVIIAGKDGITVKEA